MNNLPLQPLVWIEANHPNGVYFEKTNSYIKAAICFCSTLVTDYVIRHDNDTGMYVVNYGGRTENEYHTLEEAKEWCEFTHYPSKMQPYVKPSPTWIDASERLPEMYQRVLIKADCYLVAGREPNSERNKNWGISGDWIWSIVNDNWCDAHMVTHWMPIPEFKQGE